MFHHVLAAQHPSSPPSPHRHLENKPSLPLVAFSVFFALSFAGCHESKLLLDAPHEEKVAPQKEAELLLPLEMALDSPITEVQLQRAERIRQREETASLSLTRVDVQALNADTLLIGLSPTQRLRVSKKHSETVGTNHFIWSGEVSGAAAQSTFVVHNGNVTANIRDANHALYHIEPIGEGLHALTQINVSSFPPSAPPLQVTQPLSAAAAGIPSPGYAAAPATRAAPVEIDVLVAFTPSVRRAVYDIESRIQLALAETHQTYQNSEIHIRLNWVDSFEWDYAENSNWNQMIQDFAQLPLLNERRNISGADAAILLVNHASYCGLANMLSHRPEERPYESARSVALVYYACLVGTYAFAHELGHIQGAHHNEHIATNWVFPYGHGYIHSVPGGASNFSTVMSYNFGAGCAYGCPYIPHFSNPDILYNGIPTGTEGTNNNARVLNETAANLASFRESGGGVPICNIDTQPQFYSIPTAGGYHTLVADCWGAPSSFTWTVDGQLQPETGGQLNYNFPANDAAPIRTFTVDLTATNSVGTGRAQRIFYQQTALPECSPVMGLSLIPHTGGLHPIHAACLNHAESFSWTVNGQLQSETRNRLDYHFPANTSAVERVFTVELYSTNSIGTRASQREFLQEAASVSVPSCTLDSPVSSIPQAGGTYDFSAHCTNLPISYRWTVDGVEQSSTGSTLTHGFQANDTSLERSFMIEVTATNNAGTSSPVQLALNQHAAPPPPPPAPILYNLSVTDKTSSSVSFKLSSDVDATVYWVVRHYSVSVSAEHIVNAPDVRTGFMSAHVPFAQTTSGLSSNTSYNLHLVAMRQGVYSKVASVGFATLSCPSALYVGQWHNRNEDGWGLTILQDFPSNACYIYVSWSTYNRSGNAAWLIFQTDEWLANNTVKAKVYRYKGPPWNTHHNYNNVLLSNELMGTATLKFTSSTTAVFDYDVDGMSRSMQLSKLYPSPKFPLTGLARQRTGPWFKPDENNWGLSFLQAFDRPEAAFVPWFTYDSAGNASWLLFQGDMNGNTLSAEVRRYRGPAWHTHHSYNNNLIRYDTVGTATLRFDSATTAWFNYDVDGMRRSLGLRKLE